MSGRGVFGRRLSSSKVEPQSRLCHRLGRPISHMEQVIAAEVKGSILRLLMDLLKDRVTYTYMDNRIVDQWVNRELAKRPF